MIPINNQGIFSFTSKHMFTFDIFFPSLVDGEWVRSLPSCWVFLPFSLFLGTLPSYELSLPQSTCGQGSLPVRASCWQNSRPLAVVSWRTQNHQLRLLRHRRARSSDSSCRGSVSYYCTYRWILHFALFRILAEVQVHDYLSTYRFILHFY